MSDSMSSDRQRIIPYLYYEDGGGALEFLCKAFGFEELFAVKRADGSLMHGEVGYQSNVVALGTPLDESGSPKQSLRGLLERPSSVMCSVDDIDAHFALARDAGAQIDRALEDQPYGARTYTAVDPEGHVWHFTMPLSDGGAE